MKDTPDAAIGTDGIINLTQVQDRLDLIFDQVNQVSAIKLTVFEADGLGNYGVVTELLVHPCK